MSTTPGRRPLKFSDLGEVMPEVERLLAGHSTRGAWSLGQVCKHLSGTLVGSVEGFDVKLPWLIRKAIAPVVLRRLLRTGVMPEGVKLPAQALPQPGLDDRAEAEALRAAVQAFAAHTGPLADHPFFGPLTRDQWTAIHLIHCAHHLSFVVPGQAASGAA